MGTPLHEVATVRIGVEAIIIYKDEILLQRRSSNLEFFPKYLSFPGGHVDEGETVLEAVIKEISEESGLHLKHSDAKLIFNHIVHNHDTKVVWCKFGFRFNLTEKPTITNSEEGECSWFKLSEINMDEMVPSNPGDFEVLMSNKEEITYRVGDIIDGKYYPK
ncbi:NUDIX hydrolase [Candidatus Dojkabacteria bacterium]|nr:NUDIX hydrolase [Candidatus Dojkabacteria bacterium]